MSVAAALKNVILMMLIILILHFLIKNINMERNLNEAREEQEEREEVQREQIQLVAIQAAVCGDANEEEPEEEEIPIAVCGISELQRFVFEDNGNELEKFFVPVANNDDNFGSDSNLIEKHKVDEALQRTVADNKKESRIDALSFLNEFTPEKPPLGDDELMAYDSYGSMFGNACGNAMTPWDSPPPDACQRSL